MKGPVRRHIMFDPDQIDNKLPIADQFYFPTNASGDHKMYFCSHSLGLQVKAAVEELNQQMANWQHLAVDAHMKGDTPWLTYTDELAPSMSRLVGAEENEVVIMNSLTVNLHLLLTSFYRPRGKRTKIVIESPVFPSDIYAVRSHLQARGSNPRQDLLIWKADKNLSLDLNHLEHILKANRDHVQLLLVAGLNYLTGEYLDIPSLADIAHRYDVLVGLDLAHAVGNVPLKLHQWNVDFAAWCNYKYVGGGPGCPAAAFIHRKHHSVDVIRLEGWWGNDINNRFEMLENFTPAPGAAAWALSTPTSLSAAPLKASLQVFDTVGMISIREKSRLLTAYLEDQILKLDSPALQIITPSRAERRGAMISIRFKEKANQIFEKLAAEDVVVDFRRPDTIRISPNALYHTFDDIYRFVSLLGKALTQF